MAKTERGRTQGVTPSDAFLSIPATVPQDSTVMHSAEYYRRLEEEFDETAFTQRIYAKESENLQDWIKRLWYRYCGFRSKDPLQTLKLIPINILHNFFHWVLRERSETLRTASSLQTYWNTFCLVRRKETGLFTIDPMIKSQMRGVRQRLAAEFKLCTEKKPKPIVRAEDEFELLKTLWSSDKMPLQHERLRVQLALLIQLAGITGNRPGALLSLRYDNIKVTLLRDPAGSEWPRVLFDLTFKNTKGYLGLKDANTFGIPDVPSEPCLLLCPQVMLLSLIFADQGFAAPNLNNPDQLFRLRVTPGLNQQELPIKESMGAAPIFRALQATAKGSEVSSTASATDNWLRGKLKDLGLATGFELPVGPYCFRRGNGEALDSSSLISDSQRNLILQHASSAVFQQNYLSRYITSDTQAIYRGLDAQTAVMRAASGMSRSIDPRRPTDLNESQLAEVRRHPEVKLLLRMRNGLAKTIRERHGTISRTKGTAIFVAYQEASRKYQSKMKAVRKALVAETKARYRKQQPIADIELQLGKKGGREENVPLQSVPVDPFSVERRLTIAALLTFATDDPAEACKRRSEAISAVTALSLRQERTIPKVCRPKHGIRVGHAFDDEAKVTVPTFTLECLPTQCIFCLGDESLSLQLRAKCFHSRGDFKKHFHRKHLRHHPDGEAIQCPHPLCDITLEHKMHLQNHAATVHKVIT